MRDKSSGKSKGFAFIAYEDQRSTILAVGLLSAITINLIKRSNKNEIFNDILQLSLST